MDIKSQAQEILKNVAAAKKLIAQIEGAVKRLAEGKATEVNTKLMAATLDKLESLLIAYQPEPELPVKLTELEAIGFISEARPESIGKRSCRGVPGPQRPDLDGSLSEQGITGVNADDSQCNPTKLGAEVASSRVG